jgi:hypothetical protein
VTAGIRLKTGQKTIRILPSKQKLSGHAGQTTFWGFLAMKKLREKLAGWLPHRPISPNASKPVEVAMGFIAGVLAGAERLTQIAHLRADPVLPEVMEVRKLPSQSTLTRFLQVFNGAACNLHCFRQAWHWGMQLLPARREGYTLDLDGTGLLHEDGKQEGVRVGHTRVGLKPCLQPLLAAFAEIKICAQMWLRAGNAHAASNVVAFVQELFSNLPSHLRLRLVRGDSGFQYEPLLCLLEERRIAYVIAADLSRRIQSVIKKHTAWRQTALPGVEVADVIYESPSASRARRVVIIRRRIADDPRGGGKLLLDCPGYKYQALVTSLPWYGQRLGSLARIQWASWHRECDQGATPRVWFCRAVLPKVLRDGSCPFLRGADLQLERPLRPPLGLAGAGDNRHPALSPFWLRRHH